MSLVVYGFRGLIVKKFQPLNSSTPQLLNPSTIMFFLTQSPQNPQNPRSPRPKGVITQSAHASQCFAIRIGTDEVKDESKAICHRH